MRLYRTFERSEHRKTTLLHVSAMQKENLKSLYSVASELAYRDEMISSLIECANGSLAMPLGEHLYRVDAADRHLNRLLGVRDEQELIVL